MADLFLIRERLKFSLRLAVIGVVLGLLGTWYFWSQLEFAADRSQFLLSAVITGGLALAAIGLLLFYIAAKRVTDPSKNLTDRFNNLPWWVFKIVALILSIIVMALFIYRLSAATEDEFDMIRDGHLVALEERIKANPAVVEKKESKAGGTLIQVAFSEGYHEAVTLLLQNGAHADEIDPGGRNPIIVSLGTPLMLKSLLEAGFDPDLPDAEGIPPIHYAVTLHAEKGLSILLEAGANIDARDPLFRTALIRAVETDDLTMIKALLDLGAGVNEYDRRGDTPLHKAARRRNAESIRLLIERGANPRIFNFVHMTPLHLVALGGHNDLVSIFLELPDMTGLYQENGLTPLNHALRVRKYETAELLIEKGADINRIQANGDTLLHHSILNRDYRTARFLIRGGADVYIENAQAETAHDIIRRKQLSGLLDLVEARDNPGAATNAVETVEAIEIK